MSGSAVGQFLAVSSAGCVRHLCSWRRVLLADGGQCFYLRADGSLDLVSRHPVLEEKYMDEGGAAHYGNRTLVWACQ